jgi:hypothetical protein
MKLLLAMLVLLLAPSAFAYDYGYNYGGMHVTVEPVFGFEWAPKTVPDEHLHGRLTYGARVIAGMSYLSLEAEYTHASDQEDFASGLSTQDTTDRVRLGLRSGYNLGSLLEVHARAGGEAEKNKHDETSGGITTTTYTPVDWNPYIGAGFRVAVSSRTYATADVVVTVHDVHDMQKNEYQTTAGLAVQFP